jgi:hypothetical protein
MILKRWRSAFPPSMFDPRKRDTASYKDLWKESCELAAEDTREHNRTEDRLRGQISEFEQRVFEAMHIPAHRLGKSVASKDDIG